MFSQDLRGNNGSQAASLYSSVTVGICDFPIVYVWIGVSNILEDHRSPVGRIGP